MIFYISGTFFNVHFNRGIPSPYFISRILMWHILYYDYLQLIYKNYFKQYKYFRNVRR